MFGFDRSTAGISDGVDAQGGIHRVWRANRAARSVSAVGPSGPKLRALPLRNQGGQKSVETNFS
jgi:hypothetical protein